MNVVASRINVVGLASSIGGVVALISFYGFKTARDVSNVFLATDNRDLFGQISEWSMLAGFILFGLGILLSGVSSLMRKDEIEKKDIILGIGVPVLGVLALVADIFLF